MERLIADNPKNAEVIFPYIGGKEVNDSPIHAHHRYVINFGDRCEDECRRQWPELMEIIEKKVKPERMQNNRQGYRRYWWQYAEKRGELSSAIGDLNRIIVTARVSQAAAFCFLGTDLVYSEMLIIFALDSASWGAVLQSRFHGLWARLFASSMKDDLRYAPSDCFETFPFPFALLGSASSDHDLAAQHQNLEAIGERYHQFRAELMVANNEGLTSTYNRFHDPSETSDGILELRSLHQQMDQAVLQAYGWETILTSCGFGLDYLDSDNDTTLPPELQERIVSGDLFFATASEACAFQSQLRQYGAVKASRRLAWRHRWPDAVRDEVLARLLALNAERYAEEQAKGLQGKASKAGAGGGGKRTMKSPGLKQTGETSSRTAEQISLLL
jgi:hypothetical protein